MSLSKVRAAFPNEITPTHYEVWKNNLHDTDVNNNDDLHPNYVGRFNNLEDAHKAALKAHYEANNIEPMKTGYPQLTPYGAKAGIRAVYPDKSYVPVGRNLDSSYIHVPNGHIVLGHENEETNAAMSIGSKHRQLIHDLTHHGRALYGNQDFPHSTPNESDINAMTLRDAAWREHDPHIMQVAADALEEAGVHPEHAQRIREGTNPSRYRLDFYRQLAKILK